MSKSLGKGLEALIPGWTGKPGIKSERVEYIPIERIKPSVHQPRTVFHEETIQQLSESIKDKGIIQPIVVMTGKDGFEIIAGERRYRAALRAGLAEIPVIVKRYNEEERFEVALLENLQREDLNAIDEAEAFQYLATHYGLSQEQLADKVKKKRSTIANALRLLALPDEIQDEVQKGAISAGQARALLSISDPEERMRIVKRLKQQDMSVRELEAISRSKKTEKKSPVSHSAELREIEEDLMRVFGTKVHIASSGKGKKIKGGITIRFTSLDDLNRILELLSKKR